MHLSRLARLPLALIIAVSMLMTLVSVVAAAPSSGPGGSRATLADHIDPTACDVFFDGAAAADVLADLQADESLVLDAELVATLTLLADAPVDACVDFTELTVQLDACLTDLELVAQLVTAAEFDAIVADLVVEAGTIDPAALAALEVALGIEFDTLTDEELVQVLLDEELVGPVCLELDSPLGDVLAEVGIVCVEVMAIDAETGVIDFEVVFGADLVDDAMLEAFAALLADLDLEVGDTVCVGLLPGGGDVIIGDVVVVIEGDVTYGDVNIGDIVIGDCSNAVVTVVVNGVEVVTNVEQVNNGDQCVTVVEEPAPASPAPTQGQAPTQAPAQSPTGGGVMLPDTAGPENPVGSGMAAVLALLMVASLGGLAAVAARKRLNG